MLLQRNSQHLNNKPYKEGIKTCLICSWFALLVDLNNKPYKERIKTTHPRVISFESKRFE